MADITFDYTPTTGAVLSADGVSRNLYQSTASRSLFETLNGRVTFPNLAAGGDPFKIQPHLVRPGQAGFARSEGRVFSADYFSDLPHLLAQTLPMQRITWRTIGAIITMALIDQGIHAQITRRIQSRRARCPAGRSSSRSQSSLASRPSLVASRW